MKKVLLFIVAVIIVAGGISTYYTLKNKNNTTQTAQPVTKVTYKVVDACKALTGEDAVALLNDTANRAASPSTDVASPDIAVSTCSYTNPGATKIVSLMARSAKSPAGIDGNKVAFGANKPSTAQNVTGVGDAAFWSPSLGQLNVHVSNNWYVITSGSVKPAERTADDAKTVALHVLARL